MTWTVSKFNIKTETTDSKTAVPNPRAMDQYQSVSRFVPDHRFSHKVYILYLQYMYSLNGQPCSQGFFFLFYFVVVWVQLSLNFC